jgi:hypothetical protein
MNTASKFIGLALALTLTPGLLIADDDDDDDRRGWHRFRGDREDYIEEREERLEEWREAQEERLEDQRERLEELREEERERAEEWRERGGRAPLYVPPQPRYEVQPRYQTQPGYESYRYERHDDGRTREFFIPPPPEPEPGYRQHGAYYPPRHDDDDDLDAVYTPFGYYEELPDSGHDHHGRRQKAHGQIGPFRFEVWK